ncbi:MAG: hypothetical protein ACXVBX_11040, partial [Flavisolibacter sp.]
MAQKYYLLRQPSIRSITCCHPGVILFIYGFLIHHSPLTIHHSLLHLPAIWQKRKSSSSVHLVKLV